METDKSMPTRCLYSSFNISTMYYLIIKLLIFHWTKGQGHVFALIKVSTNWWTWLWYVAIWSPADVRMNQLQLATVSSS